MKECWVTGIDNWGEDLIPVSIQGDDERAKYVQDKLKNCVKEQFGGTVPHFTALTTEEADTKRLTPSSRGRHSILDDRMRKLGRRAAR